MSHRVALEECARFLLECETKGAPGAIRVARTHLDSNLKTAKTTSQLRGLAEHVLTDFKMLEPKFREYDFKSMINKLESDLKTSQ